VGIPVRSKRKIDVGRIIGLLAEPVVAVLLAMVIGGLLIFLFSGLLPGHTPFDFKLPFQAYQALFAGAFTNPGAIADTLVYSAPLVLAGLGVAVGFKAGLFNIGGRGQFLVGATGAMAAAQLINGNLSGWIVIPLALLAGALVGAFAGFIPGFLKATSGAHEVVTTIMLNYILVFTVNWAIRGPLSLPRAPQPMTLDVSSLNASLPIIPLPLLDLPGHGAHVGILLAVIAVPLMWFLLYRTTLGFEIRSAGANPDAARYGGMRTRYLIVLTMSLSGFMCGLAGAVTLLGVVHQMPLGYDTTIGFDAITVALLGRSNPWGVALGALLLGAMRAGAQTMQSQAGVPTDLVDFLEAIILLFLVVNVLRRFMTRRKAGQPLAPEFASISGSAVVATEAAQ
jgi:simple sugar transport system permease protein